MISSSFSAVGTKEVPPGMLVMMCGILPPIMAQICEAWAWFSMPSK